MNTHTKCCVDVGFSLYPTCSFYERGFVKTFFSKDENETKETDSRCCIDLLHFYKNTIKSILFITAEWTET